MLIFKKAAERRLKNWNCQKMHSGIDYRLKLNSESESDYLVVILDKSKKFQSEITSG